MFIPLTYSYDDSKFLQNINTIDYIFSEKDYTVLVTLTTEQGRRVKETPEEIQDMIRGIVPANGL